MVIGASKVVEWLRVNDCPYWRIRSTEKGYILAKSLETETLTVDDSAARLADILNMIGQGSYFIEAWHTGLNTNSYFKTRFTLSEQLAGIGSFQPGYSQSIDVENKITEALDRYKNGLELERLRSENEELRNQVDTTTFRILNRIEPHLGDIIGSVFPKSQRPVANVAGTKTATNQEMATPQEQLRVEKAIEEWSSTDNDFALLVEKIAQLAKSDPSTYNMAKTMLLSK